MPERVDQNIVIRQPEVNELGAIRTLRHEELQGDKELETPIEPSPDDLKSTTIHMAAFDGEKVVSAVRLDPLDDESSIFMVSRMVTKAPYRGRGIGGEVLTKAEATATSKGARTFILDARPKAEQFYARLGYDRSDDRTSAKSEEIPMIKNVKK